MLFRSQDPAPAPAPSPAPTPNATDPAQQPVNGTTVQPDPAGEAPLVQEERFDPCQGTTGMLMIAALLVMMYLLFWRPQQKQAKKRTEMLGQIKKNDRVMTIGGIYGIVYSISGDEVTLKIDERNDVRIRVSRGSISRILGDEVGGAAGGDTGSIDPQ